MLRKKKALKKINAFFYGRKEKNLKFQLHMNIF